MLAKATTITKLFNKDFETPACLSVNNIPSLDGLRAISILWVIGGHTKFSQNISTAGYQFLSLVFGGGQAGVKLFFVISGFLITTLLIKEKIKTQTINLTKFYIRRFLRIFPVFYLYLLVVFILNHYLHMGVENQFFIIAALYLTNFFMSSVSWPVMHSWSLAVEEQYYLLWPSIFKKNTKIATIVAILFMVLAPVIRVVVYYHPNYNNILLAPFIDGADGIFTGSLLAIVCCKNMVNWSFFKRFKWIISVAGFFSIWFISDSLLHGRYGKLMLPFGSTLISLFFCCIIISNIQSSKDALSWLLNSRVFVLVGRLSYSIYVWQQLFLLAPANFPAKNFTWNTIPFNLILIAIISMISYYGFEKYFLKIKSAYKS